MNAIETTGIVDAQHQLRLDEPLPIPDQSRVRVIVLVPEAEDISEVINTDIRETRRVEAELRISSIVTEVASPIAQFSSQHYSHVPCYNIFSRLAILALRFAGPGNVPTIVLRWSCQDRIQGPEYPR